MYICIFSMRTERVSCLYMVQFKTCTIKHIFYHWETIRQLMAGSSSQRSSRLSIYSSSGWPYTQNKKKVKIEVESLYFPVILSIPLNVVLFQSLRLGFHITPGSIDCPSGPCFSSTARRRLKVSMSPSAERPKGSQKPTSSGFVYPGVSND